MPLNNLWKKVSIGGLIVIDDYIEEDEHIDNEDDAIICVFTKE